MNIVIEAMPDINHLSKHGLPVKYGEKVFILSGKKLTALILREFKAALRIKLNAILN